MNKRRCNYYCVLVITGLLLLIVYSEIQGQNQINIWYFPDNLGLDFNYNPPKLLRDGQISSNYGDGEASSVIADENGNLLFYTDGNTVWNKTHKAMPNGTGLFGWKTTTQTLATPIPGSNNKYLIFTASAQGDTAIPEERGFFYSIVDMREDEGRGDVTQKNIPLCNTTTEKIAATLHANGKDIWVVMHEWESSAFRSYLITNAGVQDEPVISKTGKIHQSNSTGNSEAIGQMKISPDGRKLGLVLYTEGGFIELFNFDHATGKINLLQSISMLDNPEISRGSTYGLEFSPDGKFLYTSYSGYILQFNTHASNMLESKTVLISDPTDAPQQLQLGPDGKIYIALSNSKQIGIIYNPNLPGEDCNYVSTAIKIDDISTPSHIGGGLPNFISSYFFNPALFIDDPDFYVDMPNVFTPNNDDINPTFKPFNMNLSLFINKATLKIFNRWGSTIYFTNDIDKGWDGNNHPEGVYYWVMEVESNNGIHKRQKGWVQLIR